MPAVAEASSCVFSFNILTKKYWHGILNNYDLKQ
jgi:hypothetical protein